ncbi:hypothetical protein N9040_09610, partial [Akkermansiaceae bacterium]|nr:hypothetical protein [Akkermansiaceae bacterium]
VVVIVEGGGSETVPAEIGFPVGRFRSLGGRTAVGNRKTTFLSYEESRFAHPSPCHFGVPTARTPDCGVFFRAQSLPEAFSYLGGIYGRIFVLGDSDRALLSEVFQVGGIWVLCMLTVEWSNRNYAHGLARVPSNRVVRWGVYYALAVFIFYSYRSDQVFIYFQF